MVWNKKKNGLLEKTGGAVKFMRGSLHTFDMGSWAGLLLHLQAAAPKFAVPLEAKWVIHFCTDISCVFVGICYIFIMI